MDDVRDVFELTQEQVARRRIKMGAEYPYDASDLAQDGQAPKRPAIDWAHAAARGILMDLQDRYGVKQELGHVEEEVRVDIVESIAMIIRVAANDGGVKVATRRTLRGELCQDCATGHMPQHGEDGWWHYLQNGMTGVTATRCKAGALFEQRPISDVSLDELVAHLVPKVVEAIEERAHRKPTPDLRIKK